MINYDRIGRTIFTFTNKNLVINLLFKILQLLGASICGMVFFSILIFYSNIFFRKKLVNMVFFNNYLFDL